jgi:serine/threonine protein kinase
MKICPQCRTPYTNNTTTCPRDGEVLSTLPQVITDVKVPKPIKPGSVIGNYQINKKLGAGGMGAVYSASHLSLGKEVAIKILREDSSQNPKMLDRFYREARALAKIEHDNVIQISDFGCTPEGLIYLVMELLTGRLLEDLLRAEKRLPVPRALHIATQICAALTAAHQVKIIHRDLKPENIFLITSRKEPDFVKVLDFGIAKQLDEGMNTVSQLMGTPLYMAPETGASIDERTDIYALGVIFYRMFTGVLPFEGSNVMDILYKHLVEAPKPLRDHQPALPLHIERAVLQALSKNKTERFASMEAFSDALCQADADATRLRPVIPEPTEEALNTPRDLKAKPQRALQISDEESTEEMSDEIKASTKQPPKAQAFQGGKASTERVTRNGKLKPSATPRNTEDVERPNATINLNTSDILLEQPLDANKEAKLFTLSPPSSITELPTAELPMQGVVPIDTETPPHPISIFGEVQPSQPSARSRQRLMIGLVVFLLLWGTIIMGLLFAAPKKTPITATPPPLASEPQPTTPEEPPTTQAVPVQTPPPLEVKPAHEVTPALTPTKQNPKKSKKKTPLIKGNPNLD